jgi:hydrogenase maturation protease
MHSKITVHLFLFGGNLRTLIFGYGNLDRQDDGVAWHVIKAYQKSSLHPNADEVCEWISLSGELVTAFQLQLTPELAQEIKQFDRVCFIDAHTGSVPEEIHFEILSPTFQHSPLTHHLTPNSLLAIIQTLYHKDMDAVLLSIRGYEFEFLQTLSDRTQTLVPKAVDVLRQWVENTHPQEGSS